MKNSTLRILTARPHRLLDEIVRRIGALAAAQEPCMLLVPSQYTLQAEIEVLDRLHLSGSFLIDVLSPGRLQSRVFERAGAPKETVFDERGKRMLLSQIIDEQRDNLTVYRSAAKSSAYSLAQKMSSLIADFKRSHTSAQELTARLQALDSDSPAARKLQDAALIYTAYEARMAGRLADAEDVAAQMLARMERSRVLNGQHVFVYGFDMITPAFAAQLTGMAPLARSLTLAIETDDNAAPDGRLFAPVNFSLSRLEALCREKGVIPERERLNIPFAQYDDLAALERGLYAAGAQPYASEPQHIALRARSTKRAEVHAAAAQIRRLLMEGRDSAEIAVVYPKGGGYAPLLSSILPMYGVSAYTAEKRQAKGHPLSRFILSALALCTGGMRTGEMTECIQSGFLGLAEEQADALCAYAQSTDLRPSDWRRPFTYIRSGDEEELTQLNAAREKAVLPLEAFMHAVSAAQDADGVVRAIVALLEEVNALDTLETMRQSLISAGLDSEAEDCAQVWQQLMGTLDQLHTLLESGGAQVALRLLEEGLGALELSALPPAAGAVICGEIGNVRTAQVPLLLAIGMNDMPAGAGSALLNAHETGEAARVTGAYLGMSDAERAALSQLDELKALSGAREMLTVSYALADETGKALREGVCVQALKRLFPGLKVSGGLAADEMSEMLACAPAAAEALSVQLSRAADGKEALDPSFAQAYAALLQSEGGRSALMNITRSLGEKPPRRLDAQQARSLYGRPIMTVSRLETFAQCPYSHFVRYGLAPQRREEPGVDRALLGTIYHNAAERFTREIMAMPDFPQIEPQRCESVMDEALTPLLDAWRASPLGASGRGEAVCRRIVRTARKAARNIVSQYSESRFRPLKTEMVFGQRGMAPITLSLPDGSLVWLQGRIDRVDVLEDEGRYIRVIDYKSGAKKFDPTMAYWGIQLQLLLYLAAALSEEEGAMAGGFFYCRIADPTIRSESRVLEEIERQIAKKLSLAGVSLSEVSVLRAQGPQFAAMITKDGKPGARHAGSVADKEGLAAMIDFARHKASSLAGEAYAGVIDDSPAVIGAYDACQYCDYAAVCSFDPALKQKRRLNKKTLADLTGQE